MATMRMMITGGGHQLKFSASGSCLLLVLLAQAAVVVHSVQEDPGRCHLSSEASGADCHSTGEQQKSAENSLAEDEKDSAAVTLIQRRVRSSGGNLDSNLTGTTSAPSASTGADDMLDDDSYEHNVNDADMSDEADIGGGSWVHSVGGFPFVYVVHGPDGPVARAIVRNTSACPEIQLDGSQAAPPVTIRGTGTAGGTYDFPVRVCEAQLPLFGISGGSFGARRLPKVTMNPSNYVLLGDTGLRVKPTNLGTCSKAKPDGPKLYGVHQCEEADQVPFNPDLVSGSYQNLTNWPLEELMQEAANTNPDIVVHVGDFLYRQGPCAEDRGCAGINPDRAYGDNWRGWSEDFFIPARSLLEAAPFVVVRGNHENCARGGHGWFLFLDPRPLPAGAVPGEYCDTYSEVYAVSLENERLIVMDDSAISPMNGGIDHMDFTQSCPASTLNLQADLTDRHWDPKQSTNDIDASIAHFKGQFETVRDLASQYLGTMRDSEETNIYISHRPLHGVACNGTHFVTLDWTMQEAAKQAAGSLDRVTLAIGGHMHWFEGLDFKDRSYPAQLVVGNGGTKLIPNKVSQSMLNNDLLEVRGDIVSKGITSSKFGFVTMTASAEGPFTLTAKELQSGGAGTKDYWDLSVQRGPRK